jgi:hypothetical protein
MNRPLAWLTALICCHGFGHPAWSEEAICRKAYEPHGAWPSMPGCKKGDIIIVYFDKPSERDVPQVAAAFCELEDIAFFRTGEGAALLCRYRGESRKTREGMD